LNGSKRKIEYDGGNTVKGRRAERERERESERERARDRRGLRGKSAEAAMFPWQKRLVYHGRY